MAFWTSSLYYDIHDIQHQSASVVFTYVQTNRTKGETPPSFETMSLMDPGVKTPFGGLDHSEERCKRARFHKGQQQESTISYAHGSPFSYLKGKARLTCN